MMRVPMDDRGQAIGIGRALATIIGIGVLWAFISAIWTPLKTELFAMNNEPVVQTGLERTAAVMGSVLFIIVAITAMGTIVLAVYQRQGGV